MADFFNALKKPEPGAKPSVAWERHPPHYDHVAHHVDQHLSVKEEQWNKPALFDALEFENKCEPYYAQHHSMVPYGNGSGYSPEQQMTSPLVDPRHYQPRPAGSEEILLQYVREMHTLIMNQQTQQTQLLQQMQMNQQGHRHGQGPIIIQNTTEVAALAQQDTSVQREQQTSIAPMWLRTFVKSRANQLFIVSGVLVGAYLLRVKLRHDYRLEQLQGRINSNVLLRMAKTVEDAFGVMRV